MKSSCALENADSTVLGVVFCECHEVKAVDGVIQIFCFLIVFVYMVNQLERE
jgi:hypothetical protein